MKRLIPVAALLTMWIGAAVAAAAADDKKVTVTGCVLKGDDGGFLLADLMLPGAPAATPQPRVLYWLKDDDDLQGHTGRRVEITGELEGELEKGQVKVERDDGVVKLEVKVDGDRELKIRLPEMPAAVGTSGASDDDDDRKIAYVVRKLDVKSVKMLSSTCQ